MVAEDGRPGLPEGVGDPLSFLRVEDNAGVVVEEHVVVVEDATVLSDRIEKPAERGERLTVERVGMGGGHHIWKGHVDTRMDGEGGLVDSMVALDDLPGMADQEKVRHPDMAEWHSERVHPEAVGVLRVAGGYVSGHPLTEPKAAEDAEGGG